MRLTPLTMTRVDWNVFIEHLDRSGASPTRGLDSDGISIESPSAFLACLSADNRPQENLRYYQKGFQHFHIGFCGKLYYDEIHALQDSLDITTYGEVRGEITCILTGSMRDWLILLQRTDIETESVSNLLEEVYTTFKAIGFQSIFETLTPTQSHKGYFRLCKK